MDDNTYYWQKPAGLCASIDLNGSFAQNAQGSISQTIATTPGAAYRGEFYLSGNPTCGPAIKTMLAIVGADVKTYTYNVSAMGTTLQNMNWQLEKFHFVAASDLTTVVLASETSGDCGPVVTGGYIELSPQQP